MFGGVSQVKGLSVKCKVDSLVYNDITQVVATQNKQTQLAVAVNNLDVNLHTRNSIKTQCCAMKNNYLLCAKLIVYSIGRRSENFLVHNAAD